MLIRVVFIILICFTLTSCLEVKQEININKDGSGDANVEVIVLKTSEPKYLLEAKIAAFKEGLEEEGWEITKEKEEEEKYVIHLRKKFDHISKLNYGGIRYTFFSRDGFMKMTHTIEIEQTVDHGDFPYEISIEVPGNIDETNGKKVSSNKVKWNLRGLSEGTVLSAKFSTFKTSALLKVMVIAGFIFFLFGVIIVREINKTKISKNKVISKVIFCIECGKENSAVANFCTNCGQKLFK